MATEFPHLTAAERVCQALRAAITGGELPAGAQLRQEEIAAQYQVSRMPVREAFRQLETEGLIVVYPGRGAFISRLDPAEIQEIYDIRILLEGDALRRAFPALTPTLLDRAQDLLDQLDTVEDRLDFRALDEAFHTTLYTPAQRPRLLTLIDTLRRQVTYFFYVVTSPDTIRQDIQQDHRQILAACRAGNADGAVAAVEAHLRRSAQATLQANQHQQSN
ncbi:MAG: GntR family transcriptional regulator [Anaerolineae bacterium]|nr:GntR family transcriptional regulator [Anaerolineae bacterium]